MPLLHDGQRLRLAAEANPLARGRVCPADQNYLLRDFWLCGVFGSALGRACTQCERTVDLCLVDHAPSWGTYLDRPTCFVFQQGVVYARGDSDGYYFEEEEFTEHSS